jgi:hypothetical protein
MPLFDWWDFEIQYLFSYNVQGVGGLTKNVPA